ncbi:hypothetical protein FEF34_37965 [Streptomyces marianii]|uniref:Uncharacterized protein n=1 Tax=Streptomyces marianii TaxID=1817406 RepID=A0A5R9DTU6_9ACTN|nr:hypothetical protein FEF34_37965 [Streptomyces marianii]
MSAAAEVLRGQLARPGGYHRGRAVGIAERLMGVKLGVAQETALDVWGAVYGTTSGTLHGAVAEAGRAARLYAEVLAAARQLLVPLPGRAARVLELTALESPDAAHALELARWADPRAAAFFFRSRPAAAWLPVLQEHAPHLLLPDAPAGGVWPAGVFFEDLAAADPPAAGAWLAEHAEEVAAAGRPALDAVLRLAGRGPGLLPAALVRTVLAGQAAARPAGEVVSPPEGWTLRLAAEWACAVPVPARDRDWVLVVELLLKMTVEAEHAAARVRRAGPAARARAAAQYPGLLGTGVGRVLLDDPEDWERAALAEAARMPDHLVGRLLQELVASAHPDGPGAGAHPQVRMIRAVVAARLARDVELTDPAARRVVFHEDLHRVRLTAPAAFGGPRLARAVLDLAAADADAGEMLAERTAQWKKVAAADAWLHDLIWAAHLAVRVPDPHENSHEDMHEDSHEDLHEDLQEDMHEDRREDAVPSPSCTAPSAPPAQEAAQWQARAHELVPRLLGGRPDPEPARLVEAVWRTCPPDAAAALEKAARAALGTPPSSRDIDEVLPAGADGADGRLEPLASWLRVWDWSPVLPARLLAGFEPLLAALRRMAPDGPADPRAAARPEPFTAPRGVDGEDLVELAAARGPLAAAAALNAAGDRGAEVYAGLLNRLVAAAPDAWTADVPAVLATLRTPALRGFYLTAVRAAAHLPGALPDRNLSHAIAGALQLRRSLPGPGTAGEQTDTAALFADEALFGLLAQAWNRPDGAAGLDDVLLPEALAHLHTLADALTRPAEAAAPPAQVPPAGGPQRPDPAVRALECLLDYAAARARAGAAMPADVLDLLARVLAAGPARPAVSAAIGPRLPALHRHAPGHAAGHPALTALDGRPTPAAAWLHTGPADPPLLTALDRAALFASLRHGAGGPAEHLAHALTADPYALGDPAGALTEIAAGPGGPAAVSWLLQVMAWRLDPAWGDIAAGRLHFTRTVPRPATGEELAALTAVWRAALTAHLPPGALAGAGYFAHLPLDDAVWLPLARASAEHTPPHTPATAAERAAAHPGDRDALLLTARLLDRPADVWGTQAVLPYARALLQTAQAMTAHPCPDTVAQLREALINAGEVDAAHTPAG